MTSTPARPAGALAAALSFCSLCAVGAAQATAFVPPIAAALPGNAALSMPFRWSQGTLQVFVDATLLPAGFVGQSITGVRFRRPRLLGEVGYPAVQRTLTVRGGFLPFPAAQMQGSILQNRPTNTSILFGPAAVNLAASPAPAAGAAIGADLVRIVFSQPLPVAAGMLFLEFEGTMVPWQISPDHWVDGVWLPGADTGYAVTVGDGSCTTRSQPTELRWTGNGGPAVGGAAAIEVRGAPPTFGASVGLVVYWLGVEPQASAFGLSLAGVDPSFANCFQWAPTDLVLSGVADIQGRFATTFPLPAGVPIGVRLGVQAAWFDGSRPVVPLSLSNGLVLVLGSAGVGTACNSIWFPAASTVSPWQPFIGQMPVLMLEH
jgi:hypothetical protein